jgi:hypothetical protein
MSALPSSVGLPQECMLGSLDYSIPPDAKSFSVKVQPSNQSSVTTPTYVLTGTTAAYQAEQAFTSQQIIFDLPCGASPSQYLDTIFTTLNCNAVISVTAAGISHLATLGYLRSYANSFLGRMYVVSQNDVIFEDVTEYCLINDTLIQLQRNNIYLQV